MGAVIKMSGGSGGATGGLEGYLKQEQKTEQILMYGKDCDVNNFSKDFKDTQKLYDKTEGRKHIHIVQSFNPNDKISPQEAHEIGKEMLNSPKFEGHQAVVITHIDKDHIHNHIVINSVNLEDGSKYQSSKKDLYELRDYSDKLCVKYGLEPEKKQEREGQVRAYDKDKYQVIKKHFEGTTKSYVVETALAVEKSLEISISKINFIQEMEKQGYKTTWTDKKKNITFENQDGKKVRLSNLEKTFSNNKYTKEGLNLEFERLKTERTKTIEYPNRTETGEKRIYSRNDNEINGRNTVSENDTIRSRADESREHTTQTNLEQLHEQLQQVRGISKEFDPEEQRRIKERADKLKAESERAKRELEQQTKLAEQRDREKAKELEREQRKTVSRNRNSGFER